MEGELPDRDQGFLVLRPLLRQQSGFWATLRLPKLPALGFGWGPGIYRLLLHEPSIAA